MRSPIRWFGGKGRLANQLVRLFPPHEKYIEVFGGGASLLFRKEPAGFEVYNDIDEGLVNFFRVIRHEDTFAQFLRLVHLTPYARAEYYRALHTWNSCTDPVGRAYNWYIVARWSFAGRFGAGFGTVTNELSGNMASTVAGWLSVVERLPEIHERFKRVQVECQDWRVILKRYDGPATFLYLDPPYAKETRRDGWYKHELTYSEHEALVDALLTYPRLAMLSGYATPAHERLTQAGWCRRDFKVTCHAAGRVANSGLKGVGAVTDTQGRLESIWCNYDIQDERGVRGGLSV